MRLFVRGATLALLLGCGCAPGSSGQTTNISEVLLPIQPSVLTSGASVALKVSADRAATIELTFGQLPSGLALDRTGWVRGTPDQPGESRYQGV